jgi:hypothetical protein
MFLGNQVYVVLNKAKANFLFIIPVASRQRPKMPLLKIEEDAVGHQFPIWCFARQKKEEKHGVREGIAEIMDIWIYFFTSSHTFTALKRNRGFSGEAARQRF